MRLGVLVLLLPMLAGSATAGFVGSPDWDPVERVHWGAFRGEALIADPGFARFNDSWGTSFVDVGDGEATVEGDALTLWVPRASMSGAAYADTPFDVRPGGRYHIAFEARLLGNASEIATLVIPQGGGEELVLRGEPRANTWGFGGEWVAPEGVTRARLVLRFMIVAGEEGGAVFRAPHVGEGPPPDLRVGLDPPPWFLPPGAHGVDAEGERVPLLVRDLPRPDVVRGRFVELGDRIEVDVRSPEAGRVELLPSTGFDPFRGWWALHPEETGATLRLERGNATIAVPPLARTANVSLAGILLDVPGAHWRFRLDGSLPEGVRGQVFLREREFPRTGAVEAEHVDSSRFIEGEGPWELHAARAQPLSRRLEVILVFEVAPGEARTLSLRASSLTVEGDLERGVTLQGPVATQAGLEEVRGRAMNAFGREVPIHAELWVGASPEVCRGDPPLVAWLPPGDAAFAWRLPGGEHRLVDEAPRVLHQPGVSLVRDDVTWWSPDVADPGLPEVHLERGAVIEVPLPCAAGLPSASQGLRLSFDQGVARVAAPWWQSAGRATIRDLEGREVAVVVVHETGGVFLAGFAVMVFAGWLIARRRR